jgi:hypothetical protein
MVKKEVKKPVTKKPKPKVTKKPKPKVTKKSNINQKQSVNVKININDNKKIRKPSKVVRTAGLTPLQLAQAQGNGSSSQRISSYPIFEDVPSLPVSKNTESLDMKKEIGNQIEEARQKFLQDNTMRIPRIINSKVPRVTIPRVKKILTLEEEAEKKLEKSRKAREKYASNKKSKQPTQPVEEYEMQNNPMNFKTPERGNESFGSDIIQEPLLNPQQSESYKL